MGEAMLELNATFADAETAQVAADALCLLLDENAADWWQANRERPAVELWPDFNARFPLSAEVLRRGAENPANAVHNGPDAANALAGLLDWRDDPARNFAGYHGELVERPEYRPEAIVKTLHHRALTWYWARWEPLALWLLALPGCRIVRWESPQGQFELKAAA